MSKHGTKKSNNINSVMEDFKNGKLKDSLGKIVTDRNDAIAKALTAAGLSNKDLQKAEVLNKARVFKAQIEAEIHKELTNDNNIAKDIMRCFKSPSPKFEDIQKELTDKYRVDKSHINDMIMKVSAEVIKKKIPTVPAKEEIPSVEETTKQAEAKINKRFRI